MLPADPFISLLPRLLPLYGLSATAALERLSVSENWTYLANDIDRKLVLRVHRVGYHTNTEILSELDWIEALRADRIVDTPHPVPTLVGERLTALATDGETHAVSAFSFVEGDEPTINDELTGNFRQLGAISARLHNHSQRWTLPDGFARKRWDFDAMFGRNALWGDWRAACRTDRQRSVLQNLENRLHDDLRSYGEGSDRFGLIHGDLRLANLLDDGRRLAVIDFDDCGFGWYAYDFAAAISFHEEDETIPALQEAWLAGYQTVAPLMPEARAILPTMIMARRLLLTAWLASRAGNDTAAEFGDGFVAGTVRLAERYLC